MIDRYRSTIGVPAWHEAYRRTARSDGGRLVLFYSGNDRAVKAEVAALIDRIGFVGIDLGSLAVGGKLGQFPGGSLPNQNLVKVA